MTPEYPLSPVKGAWRAFEHEPRNSVRYQRAMLEKNTIIVMMVRKMEANPVYDELAFAKGKRTVYGQRGYQNQRAQTSDDLLAV